MESHGLCSNVTLYLYEIRASYHSEPVSSTLKWGWDVNMLCKLKNSTKDNVLLSHLMLPLSLLLVLTDGE